MQDVPASTRLLVWLGVLTAAGLFLTYC